LFSHVGRVIGNKYGPGSGRIWLIIIWCKGHEEDLSECWHTGWGTYNCHHSQDVSISCGDQSSLTTTRVPSSKFFYLDAFSCAQYLYGAT